MVEIPVPAMPVLEQPVAYALAAGAVLTGAILLLWGRRVHRVLLALAGAGAGWVLAEPAAKAVNVDNRLLVAAAMIACLAILCAVAARAIWAILAGASCGAAAGAAMVLRLLADQADAPKFQAKSPALSDWLTGLAEFAREAYQAVSAEHSAVVLAVASGAALVPLVIGLIWPRPVNIFMTALLGAVAMTKGLFVIAVKLAPSLWNGKWSDCRVPLGIAGVLMLLGLVCQGVGAARAARAARQGESPDNGKSAKDERAGR